MLKFDSF